MIVVLCGCNTQTLNCREKHKLRVLKNGILKVSGHSRGNTTVGQPGRQADTIVPISKYYGSYATYGTNQKCTQNFEWKPDETSSEALLYKGGDEDGFKQTE